MIEIVVDCNNDRINFGESHFDLERPHYTLEILHALFDLLSDIQDEGILNIQLIKIDEDTRTVVGEW